MADPFQYKTEPWEHQREGLRRSASAPAFALFMDPRTGKSKLILDNAAYLYDRGKIDGLLIVAPNGVHIGWVVDAVSEHLHDRTRPRSYVWRAGKARTKMHKREMGALLAHDGLSILSINSEVVFRKHARADMERFLLKRRCLFVLDESTDIKTPGAKRTTALVGRGEQRGLSGRAPYRRILTGTPVTQQGPLDLYAQFRFLHPLILGFTSYTAYKNHYAEWEKGYNRKQAREYTAIARDENGRPRYKNLGELQKRMEPYVYQVRRRDVSTAEKVYQKRRFELSDEHRAMYDRMRTKFVAELSTGERITAPIVLARRTRLQQIASGFLPREDGTIEVLPGKNARLEALRAEIEMSREPTIIWCRFTHDVDLTIRLARELGIGAARYDGLVSPDERATGLREFMSGNLEWVVGKVSAGGRGVAMHAATRVIYFTHDPSLERRLQSEDRSQHVEKKESTGIVDLIAQDTVDESTILAHRSNKEVADLIVGNNPEEWL